MPYQADLRLEANDSVIQLTESPAFVTFTEQLLREYRTTIAVAPCRHEEGDGGEMVLRFKCPKSMTGGLGKVKDSLLQGLRDLGVSANDSIDLDVADC